MKTSMLPICLFHHFWFDWCHLDSLTDVTGWAQTGCDFATDGAPVTYDVKSYMEDMIDVYGRDDHHNLNINYVAGARIHMARLLAARAHAFHGPIYTTCLFHIKLLQKTHTTDNVSCTHIYNGRTVVVIKTTNLVLCLCISVVTSLALCV